MPNPKATIDAIDTALMKWRGDVSAAAAELGIRRNTLYERIGRLGLDLALYRRGVSGMPGGVRSRPDRSRPVVTGVSGTVTARISEGARYKKSVKAPTFPVVQTGTAAAVEEEGRDVPIKTEPRRERPLRLRPDLRERLQRAAWRLQAHFGEPTNENLVLEQLVEETLDSWERSKLEPAVATPKKARNGKRDGGEGDR